MTHYFDPWAAGHIAHRSPDDITRCLRESIAAMRTERPHTQPDIRTEPYVDGETKIRGKSRAAVRAEWRPVTFGPYDERGYDKHGHYNPAADGRW